MEEWKPIPDFPGYEVSNLGNVKSLNYNKTGKEKIMKQDLRGGYFCVRIWNKEGYCRKAVHIFEALAFLPNSENKPTIDHINQDKKDNRLENLRWATYSEQAKNKNNWFKGTNTGEPYITAYPQRYLVQKRINNIQYRKYFKTLEEAIAYRDSLLT